MSATAFITFFPFRLDLANEQPGDNQLVTLRPKTLAVLRYLVEHAGRLIPKETSQYRMERHCVSSTAEGLSKNFEGAQRYHALAPLYRNRAWPGYRFIAP
jgi:hypothetical protein